MLDGRLRPWIDPPLDAVATRCVRLGATAAGVTWTGLVLGLAAAAIIAAGWPPAAALPLFLAGRVADGLDGAVARATRATDRGGFLDIVCDFLVYAAVPLAFAIADPGGNALAAAALLASFIASGVTFLAFAAVAATRGLTTEAQGPKSIYYLAGLAEGAETIVVFAAMMLWPAWFSVLAWGFAALCAVSAAARIMAALHALR
jgi:phosphatidylglycerophosphate synthase